MKDFFVSYNSADRSWAEWIAWVLEEQGYRVIIQAWDFRPGGNFVLDMQRATAEAKRTVMVLSDAYLNALYTQPEWAAAFQQDPTARDRRLLPIRVAPCQPTGMLAILVYVDLVGKSESEAEPLLLAALQDRAKPPTRPNFPQSIPGPERVTPLTVTFPPTSRVPDGAGQQIDLFQKLASLPGPQFEQVLFGLNPPAGNVPSAQASQSDRVVALLEWADSPIGCGLGQVEAIYSQVVNPPPPPKPQFKSGKPFPLVQLPENFVERPAALNAVKEKLLAEGDRTLVVSAISGLGGLGKSVLATALVLDPEVQARFEDGILWVTLGQNPDLQTMLGEWIRELDKSRESFIANTLEAASRYLRNLLAERRMLLVVDDVWNGSHVNWFQVGGAGCRVLVTTREAQIKGASYYSLDLMSEEESIELVRRKLQQRWELEQLAEVKAFVRVLGCLPLALDLATDQVLEGLSWQELRSEFESERQSVALGRGRRTSALKLLDSLEAWDCLDEEEQRQYSLQACFNLSLKRLSLEQLQQFAWLGVLPEDVYLSSQAAAVLWDLPSLHAKRVAALLRKRSFLTDGVATLGGEPTYRVHDLMHDMARNLVEEGVLKIQNSGSDTPTLLLAHRQFLERYRERATDQRWDGLPNDGYIHHHLTWHMEQADWADEVHALMAMSDEQVLDDSDIGGW